MDRTADDAVASPSTASSGASSKPSPHRGGKRKTADGRSYIELNLDQLNQLFGKAVKPADIQAAYRARSSDMQKAIDDLVERSGLHPELHSSFEAQQSLVSAASSSKLPSAASSSSSSTDASSSASSPTLKKARSTRLVFEQVQGDLFSSPSQSALVHCVSECLAMGKGIATIFKERFAGVDELKAQKKKIGDVAILKRDERYVYYLITKARYFNSQSTAHRVASTRRFCWLLITSSLVAVSLAHRADLTGSRAFPRRDAHARHRARREADLDAAYRLRTGWTAVE
jgi:hypothetical protein